MRKNIKDIVVAGKVLDLNLLNRSDLKGVFIDAILSYDFYKTVFNGDEFYLLVSKRDNKLSPLKYKQLTNHLCSVLKLPIVFLFDSLEYYERNRLIDRGVYFIVSNKYIYLPYLIINAKQTEKKPTKRLTSVAQYLLLYHLQKKSLQGLTINEIEDLTQYKYVTLTRAISCLEELKICKTEKDLNRKKHIHFNYESFDLWDKVMSNMVSPVKDIYYCDDLLKKDYPIAGIEALAHYTNINPEDKKIYAIDYKKFRELLKENIFKNLNRIEGDIKIKVWKYYPINMDGFVDKLSLYLALKDDKDARVEKELDLMIKKIW